MQVHLYETSEIGKSIETECQGRGEQQLKRYGFPFEVDDNVLELDRGCGYSTW